MLITILFIIVRNYRSTWMFNVRGNLNEQNFIHTTKWYTIIKFCFEADLMTWICLVYSIEQNLRKQNTKLYIHCDSNYIPIMTHLPLRYKQIETYIHNIVKYFLKYLNHRSSTLHLLLFPKYSWLRNMNYRERTLYSSLYIVSLFSIFIYILMDKLIQY